MSNKCDEVERTVLSSESEGSKSKSLRGKYSSNIQKPVLKDGTFHLWYLSDVYILKACFKTYDVLRFFAAGVGSHLCRLNLISLNTFLTVVVLQCG